MNLDAIDDFELFGLPRRFALDRGELDARWRALQAEVHPDRFAAAGAAAQRVADAVGGARQRGLPAAEGSAQARRLPVRAGGRADPRRETTPRCRPTSCCSRWPGASRSTTPATRAAGRRRRRTSSTNARRARLRAPRAARSTSAATSPPPRGRCRALMFVERFAADVDERLDAAGGADAMALLQISEPGAVARPAPAPPSPSASTSARPIRWSPRCATASPNACPTREGG